MLLDSPHPGGRVNSQGSKSLSRVAGVGSLETGGFYNDAVETLTTYCLLPPQREPGLSQLLPRCPSPADPTLLLPRLTPSPLSI